jgi:hypothetical protein
MNTKILRALTLVSYITMVGVNYLAVSLPLGGRSTGQISDNYANLFAPSGYAFSIWGLIYTLLGIYVVYQLFKKDSKLILKVNQIFIINALLNASWIFSWHYDLIWLSLIIMIGILLTLIKIIDTFKSVDVDKKDKYLAYLPFSIYFGWITVATIANVTVFLVYIGFNGLGISDSIWTVIALLVGTIIGSLRIIKDKFFAYGLVFIWAYVAILYKHLSLNGFNGQYPEIVWTAIFCIIVLIFITIRVLKFNLKKSNL